VCDWWRTSEEKARKIIILFISVQICIISVSFFFFINLLLNLKIKNVRLKNRLNNAMSTP